MEEHEELQRDTARVVDRATLLLNMLRFAQLGCGPLRDHMASGAGGSTPKGNHWGDVRAGLEVAIATLVEELTTVIAASVSSGADFTSDSDGGGGGGMHTVAVTTASSPQLTQVVRKMFVPALRDLLHHGLIPNTPGRSLVSMWSCFPSRTAPPPLLHAWDLVLQYYHLKRGPYYNTAPARRLSQSFNLELSSGVVGCGGHKGALLAAVGNILATHAPLKRSHDAHFKAFVSEALNQQRLLVWLRLVLRFQPLIQKCYQPWSYVVDTGFEDAFQSLEALQQFKFNLPADLAVRSLRNMADAF